VITEIGSMAPKSRKTTDGEPVLLGGVPEKPERAFDASTHVAVLDLKGVFEFPFNPLQSGTKSFVVILFPRNKVVHAGMSGCYVVDGGYSVERALGIAYFKDGSLQSPELILAFIDHGIADSSQTGISIESLPLPLLKGGKRYEQYSNCRPLESVVGFSSLPSGIPWSVTLVPALKGLTAKLGYSFVTVGVSDLKTLTAFIATTLGDRVPELFKQAVVRLAAEVADQAIQDARAAQLVSVQYGAKLTAMQESFESVDLSMYDAPIESRIFSLSDAAMIDAPDMLSPLRRQAMVDGSAILVRSALFPRYPAPRAKPKEPEVVVELEPVQEELVDAEENGETLMSEYEDEDDEDPPSEHLDRLEELPRLRRIPKPKLARIESSIAKGVKKKAISKAARAPRVKQLPDGQTSRLGQPDGRGGVYSREKYAASSAISGMQKGAGLAAAEQANTAAIATAARISALMIEVATLKEQGVAKDAQLAAAATHEISAVQQARLEERNATATMVQSSFQQGLNAAVRLMQQKEINIAPPSSIKHARGRSASSSRSKRTANSESSDGSC